MRTENERSALYYPFHLCHEQTLMRLLNDYRPSIFVTTWHCSSLR
jgi:hypothetical protein